MGGTFRSRLLVCSNYVFVYYISEMSNADLQTCQINLSFPASWSVPILAYTKFNLYPWRLEELEEG